jgi:hypothetical protein
MGIKVQSCQALPRSTAAMVSVCRQVSADRPQGAPWSETWPQKWHQLRRGVTLQAASGRRAGPRCVKAPRRACPHWALALPA